MKKYYLKTTISILTLVLGIFMFIYGGFDDSPGAQLLGFIMFAIGVYFLLFNNKKKQK